MDETVKEQAIKLLFGKGPNKNYKARSVLQRLGGKYPDLMQGVADHVAKRVEELGESLSAGQLATVQLEAEALGLRAALADEMLRDGLTNAKGEPSPHIWAVIRLGDQAHKLGQALGIVPLPKAGTDSVDVVELWSKAMEATPDQPQAPESAADVEADTDIPTETNSKEES